MGFTEFHGRVTPVKPPFLKNGGGGECGKNVTYSSSLNTD